MGGLCATLVCLFVCCGERVGCFVLLFFLVLLFIFLFCGGFVGCLVFWIRLGGVSSFFKNLFWCILFC